MSVTPGKKLLIGVASSGNGGDGRNGSKTAAGWGITHDGNNCDGGSVNIDASEVPGKPQGRGDA